MPNLKEIDSQEECLWLAQSYFCKMVKKNVKKMGQFSGTHILQTTGPISVCSRVYVGHKICECDRNWLSDYRDTRG